MDTKDVKLAVVGLGYVGLPLAVEFGKLREVLGFDINPSRINQLRDHLDVTLEVNADELRHARYLKYSSNPQDLAMCN